MGHHAVWYRHNTQEGQEGLATQAIEWERGAAMWPRLEQTNNGEWREEKAETGG